MPLFGGCTARSGVFGCNRGVEDLDRLDWRPLVSGHLESAAWDPGGGGLYVKFQNGSVYRYPAPEAELSGLVNAMSAGSYLKGRIERRWPGIRVS